MNMGRNFLHNEFKSFEIGTNRKQFQCLGRTIWSGSLIWSGTRSGQALSGQTRSQVTLHRSGQALPNPRPLTSERTRLSPAGVSSTSSFVTWLKNIGNEEKYQTLNEILRVLITKCSLLFEMISSITFHF